MPLWGYGTNIVYIPSPIEYHLGRRYLFGINSGSFEVVQIRSWVAQVLDVDELDLFLTLLCFGLNSERNEDKLELASAVHG